MRSDGIGAPLRRKEDRRLLTGRGRYSGDVPASGELAGVFRRSDVAHGVIRSLDTAAAEAMPGVLAVFTADNIRDRGAPAIGSEVGLSDRDGKPVPDLARPALCRDKVRMVGDLLALVVARTEPQARDAAERIVVEIDPLPAAGTMSAALAPGATPLWAACPDNIAYRWRDGDGEAVARALAGAAHRIALRLVNNRIMANAMEPRCALAIPEPDGRLRLVMGNQAPHLLRGALADLTGLPERSIAVVSEDMGGGFGMRTSPYGEEVALCLAARRLGRPVRWTAMRHEAMANDTHGRGQDTEATLALDAEGRLLGLKVLTRADLGAYTTGFGPALPVVLYAPSIPNVYRLPCLDVEIHGVLTNTSPTAPYRGAGRPEAVYLMERLMDAAARRTGVAPEELRRRNMPPRHAMPYATPTGLTYDSGDFAGVMEAALEAADRAGFADRRKASEARGAMRGLGFAAFTESAAMPGPGDFEAAHVRFHPGGSAVVSVGVHSHGQGHATVFAQIAGDRLGLPADRVEIVFGDTDRVPCGRGTYGSRSTAMAGVAIVMAVDKVVGKARKIAAHLMEASVGDVEFADGVFAIAGTDRRMDWDAVARAAYVAPNFAGSDLEPGLEDQAFHTPETGTFPNGCHVAEVEVDPETGRWTLERYTAVNDFGRVVNPLLLAGQVHGALAQGVGQAMMERVVYDPASGQLLSGSFMDYAMPRADDLPAFETVDRPDLCVTNRLGVKGAGELPTTGAPPVIVHALLDALRPAGVTDLDMPATPQTVWRAIGNAA